MDIWGGNDRKQSGFTIVEVLVVLAVTAGMLVMAATLISGKQARAEFQTGVRTTQAKIQTVLNEAASGYFPSENISCTIAFEWYFGNIPHFSNSGTKGANEQCIYAGNLLVFGPSTGPEPHMTEMKVFPVAGNGKIANMEVRNIRDATPAVIAANTQAWSSAFPDASYTVPLPGGITYVSGRLDGVSKDPISWPIALFATPINSQKWFNNDPVQATQQLTVRTIYNTTDYNSSLGDKGLATWFDIDTFVAASATPAVEPFPITKDVQLCFASGGTNQSFILAFKDGNAESTVTIKDGTTCGW